MNTKQKISVVAFAAVALAVSYWTGYVHGGSILARSEMMISIALPIILIWTLAKLTFALTFRRESRPPSGGGSPPPAEPSHLVPAPRPPGAPPEIHCERANTSVEQTAYAVSFRIVMDSSFTLMSRQGPGSRLSLTSIR